MTHADLVARAIRWLRNTLHCQVIVSRSNICSDELPDAIGWKGAGFSSVVECKVSRADFFRDQKKQSRSYPEMGVGNQRFYLVPPGMIRASEVPEGWGLLECQPRLTRCVVTSPWHTQRNLVEELRLALAQIRHERRGA